MNMESSKQAISTVPTNVAQYVCVGLIVFVVYAILWLFLNIVTFGKPLLNTIIATGIILVIILLRNNIVAFLRKAKEIEQLKEQGEITSTLQRDYEAFLQVVASTCDELGIAKPKVYIIPDKSPSIMFLTSRLLAATPTFLSIFNTDQQKAALLHAIYHVKNGNVEMFAIADVVGLLCVLILHTVALFLVVSLGGNMVGVIADETVQYASASLLLVLIFQTILSIAGRLLRNFTIDSIKKSVFPADESVAKAGYKDALIEYLQSMVSINYELSSEDLVEVWTSFPTPNERIEHLKLL